MKCRPNPNPNPNPELFHRVESRVTRNSLDDFVASRQCITTGGEQRSKWCIPHFNNSFVNHVSLISHAAARCSRLHSLFISTARQRTRREKNIVIKLAGMSYVISGRHSATPSRGRFYIGAERMYRDVSVTSS